MGLLKKKGDGEGKKAAKPKKEAKAAKKAKKEPKKPGNQSQGVELNEHGQPVKKRGKLKRLLVPVLVLVILLAGVFILRDRLPFLGGGSAPSTIEEEVPEPIEAPINYVMGESTVPALPVYNDSILVYEEEIVDEAAQDVIDVSAETLSATEGSSSEPEEEPKEEEESLAVSYRYEGLSDPTELASVYTAFLTAQDVGFSTVDESFERIEAPDFEESEGSVYMGFNAPEDGKVLSVRLDWSASDVIVTLDLLDGRVHNPAGVSSGTYLSGATMTPLEAVDFLKSKTPASLGLSGDSMENYNIYVLDGAVLVNGKPCIPMNIYSTGSVTGGNTIEGSYFLANDGSHIYRLNTATNSVTEMV